MLPLPGVRRGGAWLATGLLLSACSPQPEPTPQNLQQTRPPAEQPAAVEHIPCARGTAPLAPTCTVERAPLRDGQLLIIRHPDGAVRRLILKDGEIETADGAELLRGTASQATVGDERYRLRP